MRAAPFNSVADTLYVLSAQFHDFQQLDTAADMHLLSMVELCLWLNDGAQAHTAAALVLVRHQHLSMLTLLGVKSIAQGRGHGVTAFSN